MKLHELKPNIKRKSSKRKGQGNGTGNGTFAGRGKNGQNCRAGGGVRLGFEGGQTPLIKRMPKLRGFRNPNRVDAEVVNLEALEKNFNEGDTISYETLLEKKLIRKNSPKIKILGFGDLTKKLKVSEGILLSEKAKKALS